MARWGDGELYCMWGRKGANSNGCNYYPELRKALIDAMDTDIMFGLQRVLPKDEARIMAEYPAVNWHETECLSEAVANGELGPLIQEFKKHKIHFICNETVIPFLEKEFTGQIVTVVPPSNAWDVRERVLDAVLSDRTSDLFLFSCGMAANAFIAELHGRVEATLMDVGHIWDPFVGIMSRCDLEGKTLEDINKNLCVD